MSFDFDRIIDRRASDSGKWHFFAPDVLPMWVADMDFAAPDAITRALQERVAHGVFGYGEHVPARLLDVVVERMVRLYNWEITPDDVIPLPGLVCGLNVVARAVGEPGDSVLVNTPVYGPFLSAPVNQGRTLVSAPQVLQAQGQRLRYTVDVDALEEAADERTRLFILCNPHNPTGRAFTATELARLAGMAERRDLVICADEIHAELLLGETQHIPIATLAPEIAQRTVTLIAPSKTFNVPGLGVSFAIVQNKELRRDVQRAMAGIVPHVNVLGIVAAGAAYTECDDWLAALRAYLTANRGFLVKTVETRLPQLRTTVPEATYLAWLDARGCGISGDACKYFNEVGKVAVNDGAWFGEGGEGFVRLNFGCPRATLAEGLARLEASLNSVQRLEV
jgi:cystathionine beta-lyase